MKFKVGDKVRRVSHGKKDIHNCPVGHISEVTGMLSGASGSAYGFWYTGKDGARQNSSSPDDWELVSDDKGGPVRTVTRREIVEWSDEVLHIVPHEEGCVLVGFKHPLDQQFTSLSSTQIRSVVMVLSQVAEAMDSKEEVK